MAEGVIGCSDFGCIQDTVMGVADRLLDSDDATNLSDTENSCEIDADYVEEQFRVDRRKLEVMIQEVTSLGINVLAEDFFLKVMEDTNTQISWPSKLKIGAKSKKDPHIKVSGHPDAVVDAKSRIMAVLDTKSSRVTLKMDVSHTEHSHVIGRGGSNIKRVMQETRCHIHFPDSNRNSQLEKSNQVSLAGPPSGVEEARIKIRELLPLVFMFELPLTSAADGPAVLQVQHAYGVTVAFKQRPRAFVTTVIVRGSVNSCTAVKEATSLLMKHLTSNPAAALPVSMQLEIAPQHHLFMIGRGGANVKQLMQRSGATIHFPDPATVAPSRRGTVFVTGSIDSVCAARTQLIECLPLVLIFDLKDDVDVDQAGLSQLMEQLDVFISIKPKPKQTCKSVIVKSIERNAINLHEARRRLLGSTDEASPIILPSRRNTDCNKGLALSSIDLLGQNLLNISASAALSVHPAGGSALSPAPSTTPTPFLSPPHVSCVYSPLVMMAPPTGYPVNSAAYSAGGATQNGISIVTRSASERPILGSSSTYSTDRASPPAKCPSPKVTTGLAPGLAGCPIPKLTTGQAPGLAGCPSPMLTNRLAPGLSGCPSPMLTNGLAPGLAGCPSPMLINGLAPGLAGFPSPMLANGLAPGLAGCPSPMLTNGLAPGLAGCPSLKLTNGLAPGLAGCPSPMLTNGLAPGLAGCPMWTTGLAPGCPVLNSTGGVSQLAQQALCRPRRLTPCGSMPELCGAPLSGGGSPLSTGATASPMSTGPAGSPIRSATPTSPVTQRASIFTDDNVLKMAFCNVDSCRSSESGCDSDSSDHRVPSNTLAPSSPGDSTSLFSGSSLFSAFDYEQKKLLANKAMQTKPDGESSRVPTDFWAGLGFSKSMPDAAIRDRLKLANVRYNGPRMTTTYESINGEDDQDPWSNSNMAAGYAAVPPISAAPGGYPSPRRKSQFGEFGLSGCLTTALDSDGSSQSLPLADWHMKEDIAELFSKLGIGRYTDLFLQQEIDMPTFLTLTDQDLKEIGISTFGARRKMLLAIADLHKRQTDLFPVPGSRNPFRDASSSAVINSGVSCVNLASQSGRW